MKYIVFWIIINVVPMPCPDANKIDEFGRESSGFSTCAVYHFKIERKSKTKEFFSRDSAFAFYNRAKKLETKSFIAFDGNLEDVKIDSVKIK